MLLRRIFYFLLFLFALLLCVAAWFVFRSLAPTASISATGGQMQAPSLQSQGNGATGKVSVRERELALMLAQQLQSFDSNAGAKVALQKRQLLAEFSVKTRLPGPRTFLNASFELAAAPPPRHVALVELAVGNSSIPPALVRLLLPWLQGRCQRTARCAAALEAFEQLDRIDIDDGVAHLHFSLPDAAQGISTAGNSTGLSAETVQHYDQALARWAESARQKRLSLHGALQAAFELAAQRSATGLDVKRDAGSQARQENTAALLALGRRAAGADVQKIINSTLGNTETVEHIHLHLDRRTDVAQHFLGSAALYLLGGSDFSDYAGLYKEYQDVSRGKTFGVSDLLANRAGVRFAQRCTEAEGRARRMQAAILAATDSSDYLLSAKALNRLDRDYADQAPAEIDEIVTLIDRSLDELRLLN